MVTHHPLTKTTQNGHYGQGHCDFPLSACWWLIFNSFWLVNQVKEDWMGIAEEFLEADTKEDCAEVKNNSMEQSPS